MRAVFTGGGTGGHIYPALAVAQKFNENAEWDISYIGSENGMEKKIIEDAGIPFTGIETDGFRTKNPFRNFLVLLKVNKAVKFVKKIFEKDKPDFVFATGGYVSAPVVLAAKKLKIPVFLHEQNSIPGLTNKISSRYANTVFTTFPGSEKHFSKNIKTICTGLPVRKEFYNIDKSEALLKLGLEDDKKTVLITGGSGGALFLNNAVISLYDFAEEKNFQIIHVTGKRDFPEVKRKKDNLGKNFKNVKLYPYLSDLYNALAIADFCISRAGAAFLSEMTFLGKTGIIIPFPYAANNHQFENAKNLAQREAIIMVEEKEIINDSDLFRKIISDVLFDEKKLEKMEKNSYDLGVRNTLNLIEENILKEIGVKFE